MAVDDDPHRRTMSQAGQATGELRIIGKHRSAADHDSVVDDAQRVSPVARRGPGDPAALAVPGRDAAVEGSGELQGDERPPEAKTAEEAGIDFGASAAHSPVSTSSPAARNRRRPSPATRWSGSSSATTTRRTPAVISASAQGGVRPQ